VSVEGSGFAARDNANKVAYTFATGSLPSSGSGAAHEQEW
jgi:hypothetical protein